MERLGPMGMVFVPCRGGRCHCPEEWLEPAQLLDGTRVLAHALLALHEAGTWARSGTVVGDDADVLVRRIAGVDGFRRVAPAQRDAYRDLGFLHDTLPVFFGAGRMPAAFAGDQGVAEPHASARDVEVGNAGIADRAEDSPQVGVGCVERRLDEG